MKLHYLSIVLITLFLSCNTDKKVENQFKVDGIITGSYNDYVYLSYPRTIADSTFAVKDSAKVIDGKFSFKGQVDFPVQGWINLKPSSNIVWIYLENSDIIINGTYSSQGEGENLFRNLEVDTIYGSITQKLKEDYSAFYQKHKNDPDFKDKIYSRIKETAIKYPKNSLSGRLLGDMVMSSSILNAEQTEEIYAIIDTSYQSKDDLMFIKNGLGRLKNLAVGKPIIDLKLPNVDGELIDSKITRGNITLIDFWASWCGPCRKKHPSYVELYDSFKDENFDIFGVSIDTDEDAWKKAIISDKLVWNNVIDNKGWKSPTAKAYYIMSIPLSFLVDENGIIIEINPSVKKIKGILDNRKLAN